MKVTSTEETAQYDVGVVGSVHDNKALLSVDLHFLMRMIFKTMLITKRLCIPVCVCVLTIHIVSSDVLCCRMCT